MKMKRLKYNLILVLLLVAAAVCAAMGIAFAYFSNTETKIYSVTSAIDEKNNSFVTEVSSFGDLFTASQSEYYNDSSVYSSSSTTNRKVVRLTGDITLENDLCITADIHLDLNGNPLDLNGHTLTIQHSYVGSFGIYSTATEGKIKANGGELIIDTPNASIYFDNVMDGDGTSITKSDTTTITVLDSNFTYTAYSALYMVGEALSSDLEKRPERLTYSEVNATEESTTTTTYTFTATDFVSKKTYNSVDGAHVFVAVGCDLNLPTHYLSTDYKIEYTVTNPDSTDTTTYLSAGGNALAKGDVTLTATIKNGTNTATVSFPVHVVAAGTVDIAKCLIESRLSDYLSGSTYLLGNAIQLPTKDADLGITLSYALYTDDDNTDKSDLIDTATYTDYAIISPDSYCTKLTVTVTKTSDNTELDPFDLTISSTYVQGDEAKAKLVLLRLYGGAVQYDATQDSTTLKTVGDYEELNYNDIEVTGISYSLTSDSDAETYYKLDEAKTSLSLVSSKTIPETETESITCTVTIDGEEYTITLNILYVETGNGTSAYLNVYNNYNSQVSSTSSSFVMPFATGSIYTVYDFAYDYKEATDGTTSYYVDDDDTSGTVTNTSLSRRAPKNGDNYIVTLTLATGVVVDDNNKDITNYGTTIVELTYDGTYTMPALFDAWLNDTEKNTEGYTLASLATAGAEWIITINQQYINYDDVEMLLLYNYKTSSGASKWTAYTTALDSTSVYTSSNVSEFTLKGGIYFDKTAAVNNGVVKDATLFNWIVGNYIGEDSEVTFIENSALAKEMTMTGLTGVSDWSGVEKLTGLIEAEFTNADFSSTYTQLINLQSLQKLTLKNCKLTTLDGWFDTTQSGSAYATFPNLKVLDVSNNTTGTYTYTNSIMDFSWLKKTNFPVLESAYIYGNESDNDYQGSKGMSNYYMFEYLTTQAGVTVYNTTNSVGAAVAFENADENSDYVRLKSLVYQGTIGTDADISTVYEKFEDIKTTNIGLEGSYTGSIAWGYEGTDPKTATYFTATVTTSDGGYTLTVRYYVHRKSSDTSS